MPWETWHFAFHWRIDASIDAWSPLGVFGCYTFRFGKGRMRCDGNPFHTDANKVLSIDMYRSTPKPRSNQMTHAKQKSAMETARYRRPAPFECSRCDVIHRYALPSSRGGSGLCLWCWYAFGASAWLQVDIARSRWWNRRVIGSDEREKMPSSRPSINCSPHSGSKSSWLVCDRKWWLCHPMVRFC